MATSCLQPLVFPEHHDADNTETQATPIPCVICSSEFRGDDATQDFLKHLLECHKLVISNAQQISNIKCYAQYWRLRLSQTTLTDVSVVIKTNSKPTDPQPSEFYYMLTEDLPEDKMLRQEIHLKKLEEILQIQAKERERSQHQQGCLFCPQKFGRYELFQHMLTTHSFNIGQPDNMVFMEEFLSILQHQLDSLQCLYCNGVFKDRSTLRDHMRKKQHKKLNPQDKRYDKFYVINYLEMGRTWQEIQAEDDRQLLDTPSSNDEEWEDWQEKDSMIIYCLFCTKSFPSRCGVMSHMITTHDFNFDEQCNTRCWDFYTQLKIVNYIRRCVYMGACPICNYKTDSDGLVDHMNSVGHCGVPTDTAPWNEPHYLFPTYENDSFLNVLNDKDIVSCDL